MALFNWDYDVGHMGDFGGADYIEGLKKGGTETGDLIKTRLAIKDWVNQSTAPTGKEGGADGIDWTKRSAFWAHDKIKEFASGDTGVGYTGFGDYSPGGKTKNWEYDGEKKDAGYWYTEADWLGGKAAGHKNKDIFDWLSSTEGQKHIYKDDNILSQVKSGWEQDIANKHTKDLETQHQSHIAELDTVKDELKSSKAATKKLKTKYDTELLDLKKAQLAVKSNAPVAVTGGGAMGIGFQQGPRKTSNLQSLTRSNFSKTSNKLKVKTLNI